MVQDSLFSAITQDITLITSIRLHKKIWLKKIKISLIILYIYVNIFFKWFVISAVTRTEKHFAPTSVSASFAARSFNLCQKDQKHNEKKITTWSSTVHSSVKYFHSKDQIYLVVRQKRVQLQAYFRGK